MNSLARIHDEDLPGEAVLRTFSGSDSTLLLGVSSLQCGLTVPTSSRTSHAYSASQYRAHGSLPYMRPVERVDVAIGVLEVPVVLLLACEILG